MSVEYKKGTKLILRDALDVVKGDKWPWLQTLSAIIFIAIIIIFEITLTNNYALMVGLFASFVAFNLYAMTKTNYTD